MEKNEKIEELENDDLREELKEEIKEEIQKENKKAQLKEERKLEEEIKERRKKRKIGRIIWNTVIIIFFLVIIFEAAIGIINMQRISDDKEPVWYISSKKNDNDKKKETSYNLGLYKIIKTETSKQTKITLKPFFIK